ncbi:hypothetical protein [Deinococcus wulumuqiensis]|uniref:hypothetical protein n=1 Tax=Deinococcus wulumuqiensis TaxID=980427 RepID=UPI0013C36035|nr:hypothetical protein [Deinococcus wulumuqiensis]
MKLSNQTYVPHTGFPTGFFEHLLLSLLRHTVSLRRGENVFWQLELLELQWAYVNIAAQGKDVSETSHKVALPAEWEEALLFDQLAGRDGTRPWLISQAIAMGYAWCYRDPIKGARMLAFASLLGLGPQVSTSEIQTYPSGLEHVSYLLCNQEPYLRTLRLCGDLLSGIPAESLRPQLLDEYLDKFGEIEPDIEQDDVQSQFYLLSLGTSDLAQQLFKLFLHALYASMDEAERSLEEIWPSAYRLVLHRLLEASGGLPSGTSKVVAKSSSARRGTK